MYYGYRARTALLPAEAVAGYVSRTGFALFIPLHDANELKHIRLQYVTLSIIAVNCLIWLLFGTTLISDEASVYAAIFSYGYIPAVANGYESLPSAYAQLPPLASYVTYSFLHGNFMHLAGNMLFIWVFGDNIEDAMGHLRFLLFYVLCAAAGAVAHGLILPASTSPLIGASGAAAGIIAAYVMLHPRVKIWILALGRIPIRLTAFWVIGAWIIFQIASLLFTQDDSVSWGAHVGGILAGAILLPLMKRRNVSLFDRKPVEAVIPPVESVTSIQSSSGSSRDDEENRGNRNEQSKGRKPMPWGRQPQDRK
jgi:membrane associated rhomboid family serine protease